MTLSFDRIDAALADAGQQLAGSVKVSAEPTFAALWLAPHIQEFRHLHPEIDVEIDADPRLVRISRRRPRSRYSSSRGPTSWARVEASRLLQTRSRPVMTRDFIDRHHIASPDDLAIHPLLHEENRSGWSDWFRIVGVEPPAEKGTVFADGGMALQAALRGHGAALFDLRMIDGELASGALVRLSIRTAIAAPISSLRARSRLCRPPHAPSPTGLKRPSTKIDPDRLPYRRASC